MERPLAPMKFAFVVFCANNWEGKKKGKRKLTS